MEVTETQPTEPQIDHNARALAKKAEIEYRRGSTKSPELAPRHCSNCLYRIRLSQYGERVHRCLVIDWNGPDNPGEAVSPEYVCNRFEFFK